jgi:type II secretory pathway pseudopilin PulG
MKFPLHRRNGFTLVEVTIACALTAFLAILLSTTWVLLMRPTADLIAWGQLFQEMDVATATLARDLGGSLPDEQYTGGRKKGRLLGVRQSPTDINTLEIWFDGGSNADTPPTVWNPLADDTVIAYYVDSGSHSLIRLNRKTGTSFTVAVDVVGPSDAAGMTVADAPSDATRLEIDLAFSSVVKATGKTLTRKCTLLVKKNP